MSTNNFLGQEFVNASYAAVAAELDRYRHDARLSLIVTANVDHMVMLLENTSQDPEREAFARAYEAARMRLCDSRVLQALAWLRGISVDVITGSDLTEMLFRDGWLDNCRVALIGGDARMAGELKALFPAVELEQHIPPMGILRNETAIGEIEAFLTRHKWDYILFSIGAPRSEIIAHRLMRTEGVHGVALCVGASIEFLLGRKARAPKWMQTARLEWLFRLITEPRRLWRRYLLAGPRIVSIVWNWRA